MAYSPSWRKKEWFQTVKTTDATVTTIKTIPIRVSSGTRIWVEASAERTGGVSGTAGDTAGYILTAMVKNSSTGTAALVGSVTVVSASEDQAAWDCTISVSGGTALVTVAGASGNNVTWNATIRATENV